MAKAKRSAPKRSAPEPLARLRANMRQLQRDAEQLLSRTRKQASGLISRDQKRALDRLVTEAKRLGGDLEKRAQRAQKEVETRAEKLFAGVEQQLAKRIEPLLRRLDLPSRKEVHALTRRVGQLENRLKAASAKPSVPPAPAAPVGITPGD